MKKALAIAALLSTIAFPLAAQSTMQGHHPDSAQAETNAPKGMMGGQMKGGMMMGQGMMECPMMDRSKGAPRTEGRLAFLKAELKIKSNQDAAWNDYAQAIRSSDQGMTDHMAKMHKKMMTLNDTAQVAERPTAPKALQSRIEMMEGMLVNLKSVEAVTSKLYETLDQPQKKTADELLGISCSMMRM